ncbi:putative E3 ubiquitin-protein ligase ARI6 [Xyrichtys novacula]|uniref:E3 ubiquitin-protein ligase ARI6 n=1 Tax=Xyrichtys novacula TaxID=13765 RepID=A0AAV1HNY6_XYRNO|nr:putative E3 ubiquitin-protein ligase ARI6 [Xyrichtys novacula]
MSCGHTVTPSSLMTWIQVLVDKGETRFVCGQPGCNVEWPCEEVYKKALMTPEEIDYFDRTLFNRAKDYLDIKKCPGCKSLVMRKNLNDLRVFCPVCSTNEANSFEFCWQCLKEWKRPSPYSDRCAEPGCVSLSLEILRRCPEIIFEDMVNITGCPSIRACPTCGLLIEHNKENCKNITCRRCKVKFCFVCLKLTEECLSLNLGKDPHYIACVSGIAPRQTSIPVWKKGK